MKGCSDISVRPGTSLDEWLPHRSSPSGSAGLESVLKVPSSCQPEWPGIQLVTEAAALATATAAASAKLPAASPAVPRHFTAQAGFKAVTAAPTRASRITHHIDDMEGDGGHPPSR
mmetsp:Transcript_125352/g.348804  ORF Transcript_125352/g.348804 Transcript_125352/m.348804 type:complete len:116 (+) Transcript_125352:37-384(+)